MKSMKSTKSAPSSTKTAKIMTCQEVRTVMLVASSIQMIVSIIVVITGAALLGMCNEDRFGDWAMIYGSIYFASSAITTASVHGRQRQVALFGLGLGISTSVTILIIDGIGYFCVDLRNGANRGTNFCRSFADTFNSCKFSHEWVEQPSKSM